MKCRLSLIVLCSVLNGVYAQNVISQGDLPLSITQPGLYTFASNLSFGGGNNAIEINAHDVTINMNGYELMLNNAAATGICAKAKNFTIQNGHITGKTATPTGAGIRVFNTAGGCIQNITTFNHKSGLKIKRSCDVNVKNCTFVHSLSAAAWAQGAADITNIGSTNIQFENCIFRDAPHGIYCNGFNNKDFKIKNCQFPDASQTDLLVLNMSGLVVEGCSFTNKKANDTEDNFKQNMVQFGAAGENNWVDNVIMKNCTLVNSNSGDAWIEGLNLRQTYNALIESCNFSMNNIGIEEEEFASAVHLGNWNEEGMSSFNCVVRNCVIGGFSLNGINIDEGCYSNTIEDCTISETILFGIYMWETESNTIRNNVITYTGFEDYGYGVGLYLDEGADYNAINDNAINSNSCSGILNYGQWNIFQHNQTLNNDNFGIDNEGGDSNVFVFNLSGDNCTDYNNVPAVSVIGSTPTLPGENLTPNLGGC